MIIHTKRGFNKASFCIITDILKSLVKAYNINTTFAAQIICLWKI